MFGILEMPAGEGGVGNAILSQQPRDGAWSRVAGRWGREEGTRPHKLGKKPPLRHPGWGWGELGRGAGFCFRSWDGASQGRAQGAGGAARPLGRALWPLKEL